MSIRNPIPIAALLAALCACASTGATSKDPSLDARADDAAELEGRQVPSTKTLYSMSRILAKQEKDAECEAVLLRLVTDHPEFRPAYADLADLYLRHDRVDSAIEVLKAGVKAAPEDAVLRNNMGMCYLLRGRNEEALECFTAAAMGTPRDARARSNMAVALGMMGRMEEALSVYLQVMAPADAHHNLGVLYESRGDAENAAREFAIAEELRNPKKKPAPAAPAPATQP